MKTISKIERKKHFFSRDLSNFYGLCSISIPKNLIGTDLLNRNPDLNQSAIELLEEDGVENFLEGNDVVFMMHQGYQFWYFRADGNPDPPVFGYHEKKLRPDNFGKLSDFIKKYST
jgi:hypothetical protein